ncbi:MAG TPA: ABC transporter substrate-binding protein [Candidatus Binataceae bacterium]|nr:ABC transporter substrate-binding protein [Candidatus Binataceae bacterium]
MRRGSRISSGCLRLLAVSLCAFLLAAASLSGAAIPVDTPRAAVVSAIDQAIAVLHDTAMPVEQRRRALRALAEHNLDLAKMAATVLGTHWTEMTPAQQQQFVPLFEAFIESAYLDEIQEYARLKIEIGDQTLEGADHARVAATVLQPGEDPIKIDFMLERGPRGWLMFDVVVDDIGIIENYRAQFDRVIRTRGLARLEAELRMKQAKLDAMLGQ